MNRLICFLTVNPPRNNEVNKYNMYKIYILKYERKTCLNGIVFHCSVSPIYSMAVDEVKTSRKVWNNTSNKQIWLPRLKISMMSNNAT